MRDKLEIPWWSKTFCLILGVQIIYEHSYYCDAPVTWGMGRVKPGAGSWKHAGQGSACSDMADMVLITWPYVSPLYFTKPGVHWEYATVAGEPVQAFVCFTEAGRRAWRTARHADHSVWRNIYLFRPGGGSIPGGCQVPPRVVWCTHFNAGLCVQPHLESRYACKITRHID